MLCNLTRQKMDQVILQSSTTLLNSKLLHESLGPTP